MSNDAVACSIRKPLEETVGLSQEQTAAIVARILGRPVYLANITGLQHPGTGEVYRVATTDGEQFLLKGYRSQPGFSEQTLGKCVRIESQNLANINKSGQEPTNHVKPQTGSGAPHNPPSAAPTSIAG